MKAGFRGIDDGKHSDKLHTGRPRSSKEWWVYPDVEPDLASAPVPSNGAPSPQNKLRLVRWPLPERRQLQNENLRRAMCRNRRWQEIVLVCVLTGRAGEKVHSEVRKYGTTTPDLRLLKQWLNENGCTPAVMESTGTYWKPVLNVLEPNAAVLLANARHVKNVPGRKSDVLDCQWLAEQLRHGLIRGSFIPPRDINTPLELLINRKRHSVVRLFIDFVFIIL